MRYVSAYLLAVLGGNDKPTDVDIKKILSSVGIDADASSLKKVIDELKGKNLEEVIAAGKYPITQFYVLFVCDGPTNSLLFLVIL